MENHTYEIVSVPYLVFIKIVELLGFLQCDNWLIRSPRRQTCPSVRIIHVCVKGGLLKKT